MAKKSGLGRGLDEVLFENSLEAAQGGGQTMIRIADIEPRADQPRKDFDREALEQLADSISVHGVLQPILVRKNGSLYEIIAGERRWRASKIAGLSEIPAIVVDADEFAAAQIALIENIQRADLNAYEEAEGYAALIDRFGLRQEEVAARVGKSRSTVTNALRLLDLPEDVLDMIRKGTLSAGHGRALLGLRDEAALIALAEKAVALGLSVRTVEDMVRKMNKPVRETPPADAKVSVDYVAELERRLMAAAGRRIKINNKKKQKTIEIEFTDEDDMQAVLRLLCGNDVFEE